MNYQKIWKKTVLEDEIIKYEFSIGDGYIRFGLMLSFVLCSLLFLNKIYFAVVLFLFALFYFLFYLKISNAYAFTNKRILIHRGWLSTNAVSIEYSKITDIQVEEPFIYKIFTQTGNLSINTAGTSKIEIVLSHVDNPYNLKKILDNLMQNKQ